MDFQTLKRRLQSIAHGLEEHHTPFADALGGQVMNNNSNNSSEGFGGRSTSAMNSMTPSMNRQQSNDTWSALSGNSNNGVASGPTNQVNNLQGSMSSQMSSSQHGGMRNGVTGTVQPPQQNAPWSNNTGGGASSTMMSQNSGMNSGQRPPLAQPHQGNMSDHSTGFSNQAAQMNNQQGSSSNLRWGLSGNLSGHAQSGSSVTSNTSKGSDSVAPKRKVILQQQQRLLLLRHASKCTAGPSCQTRFCAQMKVLWRHMKACRDKNCKTSHCVSSRCVLNHYRICKSNGRTGSCEVCGPVMTRIRQQERDDGAGDPLTKDQDPLSTSRGTTPQPTPHQPALVTADAASDEAQLQQVQAQQVKLKAQLDSLKQLQKRQEELLKQQRRLEMHAKQVQDPNSPQARQLHEQQMLLQHLQKKCQQQQLLLQQEVHMQMNISGTQQQQDQPESSGVKSDPVSQVSSSLALGSTVTSQPAPMTQLSQRTASIGDLEDGKGRPGGKGKKLGLGRAPTTGPPAVVVKNRSSGTSSTKEHLLKRATAESKFGSVLHSRPTPESNHLSPPAVKIEKSENTLPNDPRTSARHENTSLIPFMTRDCIEKHLESLNKKIRLSSRNVTHKCLPLVEALIDHQFGWVFREAVDPVALGLPDYFDVVKTPMHLDLVKKKLDNAVYSDMETFARDTRLVFENAILYNGVSSEVGQLAQSLLTLFDQSFGALVQGT